MTIEEFKQIYEEAAALMAGVTQLLDVALSDVNVAIENDVMLVQRRPRGDSTMYVMPDTTNPSTKPCDDRMYMSSCYGYYWPDTCYFDKEFNSCQVMLTACSPPTGPLGQACTGAKDGDSCNANSGGSDRCGKNNDICWSRPDQFQCVNQNGSVCAVTEFPGICLGKSTEYCNGKDFFPEEYQTILTDEEADKKAKEIEDELGTIDMLLAGFIASPLSIASHRDFLAKTRQKRLQVKTSLQIFNSPRAIGLPRDFVSCFPNPKGCTPPGGKQCPLT